MSNTTRSVAFWTAVTVLVGLSALGLRSAVQELDSAETLGQRAATTTQFGYALAGLLAAGALVGRRSWARWLLWLWAGLITLTGGLAPVVWGGSGMTAGVVAGVATAAIAIFVVWLATRRRAA
jgi:hypothetical protein